jgi:superfamily II RNA helicase
MLDKYKSIEKDIEIVSKYKIKREDIDKLNDQMITTETTLDTNVIKVIKLLQENCFITQEDSKNVLTLKGHIATNLREVHCLVFSELIHLSKFQKFTAKELVGILSCFTNITVPEEKRYVLPTSDYSDVKDCITDIYNMYQKQSNEELKHQIDTGFDYSIHFDLIDYSIKWCDCENDIDCKRLLHEISIEKEIFLGEFIKAILKINNITSEMEKVAEYLGDMDFLSTLRQVPQLTLKYVATNQSLYV